MKTLIIDKVKEEVFKNEYENQRFLNVSQSLRHETQEV